MKIGKFDISNRVLVIAEIGNNHEGRLEVAEELVHQAAACGVDAVKFQTFRTEFYVDSADVVRFQRLKSFELTFNGFEQLSNLAHSLGLLFISTPFDLESAASINSIVDAYKIASGDNTFWPLLNQVAGTGKPLIISAGLSDLEQVKQIINYVRRVWLEQQVAGEMVILHCVSSYPVPSDQVNIRAIPLLADELDVKVGYSDHSLGIDACVLAAAVGACIIEKHFTLDKGFSDFRDHQLSADPGEMKELVQRIRMSEIFLGNCSKNIQPCEQNSGMSLRRSIVAAHDMKPGHLIRSEDLTWIRPGGGIAPGNESLLIGKRLKRSVRFGDKLLSEDVEQI
jgi:N,N'-diacetyllegionaminate synthase